MAMGEISFRHASARILQYAFADNHLIYLSMVGQETSIRSITAMLLQGLVQLDNDLVFFNGKSRFRIHGAGNRRLLEQIGEGYAHCVFFHESVLPGDKMRVLLADDEESAFARFQQFLETACPLPRIGSLADNDVIERELFDSYKLMGVIDKSGLALGKTAYSINVDSLFEDDFLLMRETMLEVARRFLPKRRVGKRQTAEHRQVYSAA
jgi:hypothetical protein